MNTPSSLRSKLRDPEYRKAFVASQIAVGLPFQIRALREGRGWTQAELAKRAGMRQSRVSAIERAGARLNLDTLRRLAEAFDVGLIVKFAPFSEVVGLQERFDPDSFSVPPFHLDAGVAAGNPTPVLRRR